MGLNTIQNSAVYQSGSNIGIGTTSPAATLDVNGKINAATGFNLGGTLFAFGSSANSNVFLGFAGNGTMTGGANTATGSGALSFNTTGTWDTASGTQALLFNTTGSGNTAVGTLALQYNTTGGYNTATGAGALRSNTTGAVNTASGYYALFENTTGSSNTASGLQALYSNTTGYENTATGYVALSSNTTGGNNTASGEDALGGNTTGNQNTAVGAAALYSNTTGSDLTCIGYECNAGADGLSNATAIGAHAMVGASNALVLGGTGKWAVKVGIGTTTPSNILTIAQGAGQPVSDGWATFSSRRWKTNIQTLHDALGKVEQLRGVSYELKESGKHEVGVIAEEVGAVVPEVVTWEENGKDAQSVDYGRLTALLIEATKQQQALIRKQQEQIRAQQARISAQQRQIQAERAESEARFARLASQVNAIQTSLKANGGAKPEVRAEATTVRQ